MYSKRQFAAVCLGLLLALTLISQCEAFTAGAGGFKNGKRSGVAKKSVADITDATLRLGKICSVATAYCSEMASEGEMKKR